MTNVFFVDVVKLNFLICYRLGHLKKFDCCYRSFQKANCFNLYLLVYAV